MIALPENLEDWMVPELEPTSPPITIFPCTEPATELSIIVPLLIATNAPVADSSYVEVFTIFTFYFFFVIIYEE